MFNYGEYTNVSGALTFEVANQIYNDIHTPESSEDDDFKELWRSVVSSASKYVKKRNDWLLMNQSERIAFDQSRTSAHDSYLSALDSLGRYCKQTRNAKWPDELGGRSD